MATCCTRTRASPRWSGSCPVTSSVCGSPTWWQEPSRPLLDALRDGRRGPGSQADVTIKHANGGSFRALFTPLPASDEYGISLLVTDLTPRLRLDEAEETLRAIGSGEVDAFVVDYGTANEVQTLSGAHRPYRLMVERMAARGRDAVRSRRHPLHQPTVRRHARLPDPNIDRQSARRARRAERPCAARGALARVGARRRHARRRAQPPPKSGGRVAVLVSVALLPEEGGVVCLIVTDLTSQKAHEAMVAAQALERVDPRAGRGRDRRLRPRQRA